MTEKIKQIPLKFNPRVDYRREDFMVARCNQEALSMVEMWPDWPFFGLVLYGPKGCGKSHLAHVFAERAASSFQYPISIQMIDAREVTMARAARLHRENPCLVVENLTPEIHNEAMFHLFNLYLNEGGYVLFTAENAPSRMRFKLPDLQSRLNMLPAVAIAEPDDEMLSALVVKLFYDRQIMIGPDVLNYIVQNMQRSFSYARNLVAEIDAASLAYKRAVTIPLVKEVMAELGKNDQLELF